MPTIQVNVIQDLGATNLLTWRCHVTLSIDYVRRYLNTRLRNSLLALDQADRHRDRQVARVMRPRACEKFSISELSTDSHTEASDVLDSVVNTHFDAHLKHPIYPDFDPTQVMTGLPRSLTYKQMMIDKLPHIPTLLMLLLDHIDRHIPPLHHLAYGINSKSVIQCDQILTTLVTSRRDTELSVRIIQSCTPAEITQLIQLFLMRLVDPPFIASVTFAETVNEKEWFILPRPCGRREVNGSTLLRVTKECLSSLSVYQKATIAYLLEHCQRWCQSEVSHQLRLNPEINASATYVEALRFLSRLFATSTIGLPESYIASKVMTNNYDSLTDFKRHIFDVLAGVIGSHVWHERSIETLCTPLDTPKVETVGGQQSSRNSISSDNLQPKGHGLNKIRSFNWL